MKRFNTLIAAFVFALVFAGGVIMSCTTTSSAAKTVAKNAAEPPKPEFTPVSVETPQTITFPSSDGIMITADLYMAYPNTAPLILLCHRAKWSRGEYREIAPLLNLQGFNAIAIDQRSGKTINGVDNETAASAKAAGKSDQFVDALPDIQAAVDYVKANYAKGTFLFWGSSYSASLGVVITHANQNKIDGYLAFSPGEYFADQGKPSDWIATEAKGVTVPVFFSSNNTEHDAVQPIFDSLASSKKTYYLPSSASKHGSEALYESNDYSYWTWNAVNSFLLPFAVKR